MCEALRKLMEPEMNEAIDKAVKSAEENSRKNIILNALKAGNSVADISRIMQVSVEEIETIAKCK